MDKAGPEALLRRCQEGFAQHFGREPRWMALAPGRVNLMGDHTDYSGGLALPMAVDRYTVLCADHARNEHTRVYSQQQAEQWVLARGEPGDPQGNWTDYVRGVLQGLAQAGVQSIALDVYIGGDLPLGAGLSSSASLALGVACLWEAATGSDMSATDKALLCQRAENEYVGMPCGVMDQLTVALAASNHLLQLDCRDQSHQYIALPPDAPAILVINSGVKHALVDGEYAQRRKQCEHASDALGRHLRDVTLDDLQRLHDPILRQRAHHVLTENQRVLSFASAVTAGHWDSAGRVMFDSHRSLADDYGVSCPELDLLVELAATHGALGARMTGGGFGGSVVCLVPVTCLDAFCRDVADAYTAATTLTIEPFTVRPAGAARADTVSAQAASA